MAIKIITAAKIQICLISDNRKKLNIASFHCSNVPYMAIY